MTKNAILWRAFSRHLLLAAAAALLLGAPARAGGDDVRWVGTWSASMQAPFPNATPAMFSNVTLRQITHVTIGGSVVRVRFSNATSTSSLNIGAASIGLRASGASVRSGTLRTLTFGGSPRSRSRPAPSRSPMRSCSTFARRTIWRSACICRTAPRRRRC